MTVIELVRQLVVCDPGMLVIVNGGKNELANDQPVESVEVVRQRRQRGTGWDWRIDYHPEYTDPDDEYRLVVNVHG